MAAALLLCSACAAWTPNRAAAPPYGIASLTNRATVGTDGSRTCETVASGGIELSTPQVKAEDGCGSRIDAGAGSVAAFGGQGAGAAIYAAKVQADLQRELALVQAGRQLAGPALCGTLVAAGVAIPAAVLSGVCLAGARQPTTEPTPAVLEVPDAPDPSLPARGVHRGRGHVRTVDHAAAGPLGGVWYRDEDGHPHVTSLPEWRAWERG